MGVGNRTRKGLHELSRSTMRSSDSSTFQPDFPDLSPSRRFAFWIRRHHITDRSPYENRASNSLRFRTITPAKVNYPIGKKEFLAIVKAFTKHRAFLEGSPHEIKVYTNHRNLVYCMTGQMLTPRQARWTTMLSRFDFKIYHRPGKESTLPDALSRRPDYHPGKGATVSEEFMPENFRQALPAFDDLDKDSELVQLRATKRKSTSSIPEDLSRDFFPPDNDILDGLSLDPIIHPL